MSNNWENSIKSSFEKQSFQAPDSLFGKLFDEPIALKDQEKLVEAFEKDQLVASPESWEVVRHSIVVNEVWDKIESELNKEKRIPFLYWMFVASSVALVLLVWNLSATEKGEFKLPSLKWSNSNFMNEIEFIQNSHLQTNKNSYDITNNSNYTTKLVEKFSAQTIQSSAPNVVADVELNPVNEALSSSEKMEKFGVNSLEPKDWSFTNSDAVLPRFAVDKKGWYVGIEAAAGTSVILNNEVRSGFQSTSLVSNHLSFGYQIGLTAKYVWKNWQINAGLQPWMSYSQRFDSYENGVFEHEKLSISGQSMNTTIGRQKALNVSKTTCYTWDVGMYVSRIKWLKDEDDGFIDSKIKFDFGPVANFGVRFESKGLPIECGLKASTGLANLQTDESVIGKFDPIRTGFFGVYSKIYF